MQSKGADFETMLRIFQGDYIPSKEEEVPQPKDEPVEEERFAFVNVDDVILDDNLARKVIIEEELKPLVESIKHFGVLQPLIGRRDDQGRIHLLSGSRRLAAAKKAWKKKVPMIFIQSTSQIPALLINLLDNSYNKELLALDLAEALKILRDQHAITDVQLSLIIGKKEDDLKEIIEISNLHENIKNIYKWKIEQGYIIPISIMVRITKMQGSIHDKIHELTTYVHRIPRPAPDRIRDGATNLRKRLEKSKKEGMQDIEKKECSDDLQQLKKVIESVSF